MKYVALLRGINVGGKNMIKMEALRQTLSGVGFENVKSYINSGNLVFETTSKTDDRKLAQQIHDAIRDKFGFDALRLYRRSLGADRHRKSTHQFFAPASSLLSPEAVRVKSP